MKKLKNFKLALIAVALVLAVFGLNTDKASAKVKTVKQDVSEYTYHVGSSTYIYGVGVKVNKKNPTSQKAVKAVKYGSSVSSRTYGATKKYNTKTETYSDYTDDTAIKYYNYDEYYIQFKKAGTYTITYYTYSTESKQVKKSGNVITYKDILVKNVYTYKYTVVSGNTGIASVKLGTSGKTYSAKYSSNGSSSTSSTAKIMLSGKSGKIKVKAAKGYKVTSIIVGTYDKDGNLVLKKVKNGGKVTYGAYRYSDVSRTETTTDYSRPVDKKVNVFDHYDASSNAVYTEETQTTYPYTVKTTYVNKSLYKPTFVLVGYKNLKTKESITYSLGSEGKNYINMTGVTDKKTKFTVKNRYISAYSFEYNYFSYWDSKYDSKTGTYKYYSADTYSTYTFYSK